jgi:hypothetical protein
MQALQVVLASLTSWKSSNRSELGTIVQRQRLSRHPLKGGMDLVLSDHAILTPPIGGIGDDMEFPQYSNVCPTSSMAIDPARPQHGCE